MTRAVIFDLDDTLHPRRRFVQSGFAAVARHLGQPKRACRWIASTRRSGARISSSRGREFQVLCTEFGLQDVMIPSLVQVVRGHTPSLWFCGAPPRSLMRLRAHGWRLGIVTNGAPRAQARKVRALGLSRLVDHIVHAETVAPARRAATTFVEALWCLEVARRTRCASATTCCATCRARRRRPGTPSGWRRPGQPDVLRG